MKNKFIEMTKVKGEADAMSNSIMAALQHNQTYLQNTSATDRAVFRESFANQIKRFAINYNKVVSDNIHNDNIIKICDEISARHGNVLINSRLKFRTTQKAFNLYLKFLWCLDQNRAVPPHSPVDRIILNHVGLKGAWTKLEPVDLYMSWINVLKQVAKKGGFNSLQEWELSIWNKNS